MRPVKVIALLAFVILGASVALADNTDPIIGGQRGPTGSPFLPTVLTLDVDNSVLFTAKYTVPGGDTLTVESITVPTADIEKGVTCLASNAFLDGSPTSPAPLQNLLGFAPTENGGVYTCNWYAYTGPNNDPPGLTETVAQMELGCLATNLGLENDADDCAGIPGGTLNSDIVYSVAGGVTGPAGELEALSTGVPEPSSLALLLLGLAGLGALAYRRRQQIV